MEIAADFSSVNGGKDFSFSRTCCNNGLGLDLICNGCTRHKEGVASGGSFSTKIIVVGGIDNSNKVMEIEIFGIRWKVIGVQVGGDGVKGYVREGGIGFRALVSKSPVGGATKVFCIPF